MGTPDYTKDFESMRFRVYTAKEVEKMSVIHVQKTQTFDAVGYPVPGGLYDAHMGPISLGQHCETCILGGKDCPGHMGHIQLEVPTFNPILFPFMFNLLKGTCINCHRFMCKTDSLESKILLMVLRCIDHGQLDIAERIEARLRGRLEDAATKAEKEEVYKSFADLSVDEVDNEIAARQAETGEISAPFGQNRLPKNSLEFRRSTLKTFMRTQLFRHLVKCPICKKRNGVIRNDSGRSVIIDFSTVAAAKKKQNEKKAVEKMEDGTIEEGLDILENGADEDIDYDGAFDKEGKTVDSKLALMQQLEAVHSGACDKLIWRGAEVREHFREVWKNEGHFLKTIFPIFDNDNKGKHCPMDVLFFELLLVPPVKFRPVRMFKGEQFEDPQTVSLRKVLETNQIITFIKYALNPKAYKLTDAEMSSVTAKIEGKGLAGKTLFEQLHNAYLELQFRVNCLYDSDCNRADPNPIPGLRQLLEKKQGLFRMNMMGKRVNYACRSVITPDPYLDVDEIGIPEIFAKKLTFEENVNPFNLKKMRQLVESGPEQYPGANFIGDIRNKKKTMLSGSDGSDRTAQSRLLASAKDIDTVAKPTTTVFRHLQRGDKLLMNRQPSLHKPSIMGHRARILKGQKALRMNYAPCKAYNADFDGDEMNGHFIQNHVGQVEAGELANVGSSYLVPKDGTPILGLIQDHVVSGVLLTVRDCFLTRQDFTHLLLAAFAQTTQKLWIPEPAIIFPRKLWTGKQVVTAIIHNCVPEDSAHLINLTSKAKTSVNCWQVEGFDAPAFEMSESELIFHRGALVSGVIDKASAGATQYGLIHCAFELYGHKVATKIMSCFSRCFTTYLQFHGFTLGVADILVKGPANKERTKTIKKLRKEGDNIVKKTFGLGEFATKTQIKHVMASAYNNKRGETGDVKQLDFSMKQTIGKYNDKINSSCVPNGLIRSFPENSLQLMIQSGAKGSMVNAIQISCLLGQIELEGQRPPLSAVGRTLPSFKPFDTSPRAGGFVDQRFLTGINPQELFFHTMAGREGLIDTAVKTSRSGYLQRCIIKHLEGITTQYDGTVRDSDGSVIQFRYGEDGLDVGRAAFLNPRQMPFLRKNMDAVRSSSVPKGISEFAFNVADAEAHYKSIKSVKKRLAKEAGETVRPKRVFDGGFTQFSREHAGQDKETIVQKWFAMSKKERAEYDAQSVRYLPTPVEEKYRNKPYSTLGALPEKMLDDIDKFVGTLDREDRQDLRRTLFWKALRAMVEPGENVGLLAAQSIGEPSTQMTLNTFHFAGRGEMNVTLGIPRLREILMTYGTNIKTPMAEISFLPTATPQEVEYLKRQFTRVYLKKCIKKVTIEERISIAGDGASRNYVVAIEILNKQKRDPDAQGLKRERILRQIEAGFIKTVNTAIVKSLRDLDDYEGFIHHKLRRGNAGLEDDNSAKKKRAEDEASSDEEEAGAENDADTSRLQRRHHDDAAEYEGEDDEVVAVEHLDKKAIEDTYAALSDGEDSEVDDDDEDMDKSFKADEKSVEERQRDVYKTAKFCKEYKYDTKHARWCIFTLSLALNQHKVDINSIVDHVVDTFVVHQTPGIEKAVVREDTKGDETVKVLQTQGINVEAFFNHADILDVNTIYSNDLSLMGAKYGVEACHRAIVKEMVNVFSVYGIDVSPRHLTLVADYMMFTGRIEPFSRSAMASSTSPLQKMTYETSMSFMRDTIICADTDYLVSPSARLVSGQLISGGTGSFDLIANPDYILGTGKSAIKRVHKKKKQFNLANIAEATLDVDFD
uniref:DNA-directed RNA polymerase subunit n=1 Tax=Panagrellus redivivus TaxID=6233 RepID=A0A7E4WCR3_PANRE